MPHQMTEEEGRDRRRWSVERTIADSFPNLIGLAVAGIVGLLWSTQTTVTEVRSGVAKLSDALRETRAEIAEIQTRLREQEIQNAPNSHVR